MPQIELPPDPAVLLRSLRGIGYSVEDAVADIADNSLSAHARNIEVWFADVGTDVVVDIVDDGEGLDEEMIRIALRLGARERDPLNRRLTHDLGRFGLGLKTASFAVARRMALFSRRGAWSGGWAWDLDDVEHTGRWLLSELPNAERDALEQRLAGRPSGSVVRWTKTDRLALPENRPRVAGLAALSGRLRRHLGMVFHRFLEGYDAERLPLPPVSIAFNKQPVRAWSPLAPFTDRPELVEWGEPRYALGVRTEYAILPPTPMMTDVETREACLEGRRLADMQGFYIYRANRLVCSANWLGLPGAGEGRWNKEPSTQLARVAVDITNGTDEAWSLDVRKSKVVPPERDRTVLTEVGGEARARSRQRIFGRQNRAKAVGSDGEQAAAAWLMNDGRLRVNREHPLVHAVTSQRAGVAHETRVAVLSLLRHLEESPALMSMVAEQSQAEEKRVPKQILDDTDIDDAISLALSLQRAGTPLPVILDIVTTDSRYRDDAGMVLRLRERLERSQ